jgi:hypothetical protein
VAQSEGPQVQAPVLQKTKQNYNMNFSNINNHYHYYPVGRLLHTMAKYKTSISPF